MVDLAGQETYGTIILDVLSLSSRLDKLGESGELCDLTEQPDMLPHPRSQQVPRRGHTRSLLHNVTLVHIDLADSL